jgi:hypothetical protein
MEFYKLDVRGIVYLIDPTTSDAYTYNLSDPVKIGKIVWTNTQEKPHINLVTDWSDIMNKLAAKSKGDQVQVAGE